MEEKSMFRRELETVINKYNRESLSNTPDFVLAEFVSKCLDAFNMATLKRDAWYGVELEPGKVNHKNECSGEEDG